MNRLLILTGIGMCITAAWCGVATIYVFGVGVVLVLAGASRAFTATTTCPRVRHSDGSESVMDADRWNEYQERAHALMAEAKAAEVEQVRRAYKEPGEPARIGWRMGAFSGLPGHAQPAPELSDMPIPDLPKPDEHEIVPLHPARPERIPDIVFLVRTRRNGQWEKLEKVERTKR